MAAGESADDKARELRERAEQLEREAANWERGAEGERRVAEVLNGLPSDYVVFHDLQIPGSDANVDHLVVGPGGVWAVDAKFYYNKVTRGYGQGADTLWTAKTPLRKTLRATAWEATRVGELIGTDTRPVMCVIAPSIPEPTFDFADVRICELRRLLDQFTSATEAPLDVAAVTAKIEEVFGAKPDARPSLKQRQPSRVTHSMSGPRALSINWPRVLTSAPVRFIGVMIAALIALSLLPTVSGWLGDRAADQFERNVQDISPPRNDPAAAAAASTTTSVEEASTTQSVARATVGGSPPTTLFAGPLDAPPPVRYVTTCPSPGAGWVISWVWPGELPTGALGYRVRTKEGDGPFLTRPAGGWWDDPDDPPTAIRIASNDLVIYTDLIGQDGVAVATYEEPFVAPASEC